MKAQHWSEDDFLDRIYGIGPADDSHLAECYACRERWNQFARARAAILEPPAVPADLLAAQRRAIRARMDAPSRAPLRVASAAAAMLVLVLSVTLLRKPEAVEPMVATSDAQLLSEIYSEVFEYDEPWATSPVRALFVETQ
ncbi:MAG: hypothetical protein ACK5AZ_09810 [Bryobacteraceae bacterium]